jgi:DNA-binding IclR family transcriptional regulator
LLREGALAQAPDGRKLYLGPAVVDLAFVSWNYLKMVESVQSPIDELRNQIKETIFNMRAVAEDLCKALDKSFGY